MIMQAGNPITVRTPDGAVRSLLNERLDLPEVPANSAVRFYTEFSNPVKPSYSWNRSLPSSLASFTQGDSALYVGFAHEIYDIQKQNPNLNFDVARMPQVRDAAAQTTFGTIYALAVLNQSPRKAGAFQAAYILASGGAASFWSDGFGLPPARRDSLARLPTDPYKSVFFQDALIAHGFLDPDPASSDAVFGSLIEDVTSGRFAIDQAVLQAHGRLNQLLSGK
jgi:ABC-type glycerol-3-phosphate transport system substrate-binding protein